MKSRGRINCFHSLSNAFVAFFFFPFTLRLHYLPATFVTGPVLGPLGFLSPWYCELLLTLFLLLLHFLLSTVSVLHGNSSISSALGPVGRLLDNLGVGDCWFTCLYWNDQARRQEWTYFEGTLAKLYLLLCGNGIGAWLISSPWKKKLSLF